jgi:hypothetical protein
LKKGFKTAANGWRSSIQRLFLSKYFPAFYFQQACMDARLSHFRVKVI